MMKTLYSVSHKIEFSLRIFSPADALTLSDPALVLAYGDKQQVKVKEGSLCTEVKLVNILALVR
jgi:hypothetical protein